MLYKHQTSHVPLVFNDLSVAVRWPTGVLAVAANKAQLNGCLEGCFYEVSTAPGFKEQNILMHPTKSTSTIKLQHTKKNY